VRLNLTNLSLITSDDTICFIDSSGSRAMGLCMPAFFLNFRSYV